jgi:predicted AlkP superfamily phosphohydrolase/phosphomutase
MTVTNKSLAVRTLVIGLDGASFSLLRPLMECGQMPFLAKLASAGASGLLRSTLPPVTAPAWASFLTGKNPGKHGLFTWQRPLASDSSFTREWVSSRDIRGEKFWDIVGKAGYKVGIMNVPMTYPPEEVNGFMITGMLTPGPDKMFTYPAALKDELFRLVPDYIIDVDIMNTDMNLSDATEEQFSSFVASVLRAAHSRTTAAIELVQLYRPDLFMLVYTLPDRLQHSSYDYMLEAANDLTTPDRAAQQSIGALLALDQELERLVSSIADENTLVVIMSDHGFCHHRYDVYLNGWLADQGMLDYRGKSSSVRQILRSIVQKGAGFIPRAWVRAGRRALSAEQLIDWSLTKAYCGRSTENGLYINMKGREPSGIVEKSEYDSLRSYLKSELEKLVNPASHEPIFKTVYLREELYSGPFVNYAPDIVFELQEGYKVVSTPSPGFRLEYVGNRRRGIHAMDGIFIACGPMIQSVQTLTGLRIIDLTPTILHAMNLPIPESLDGQVIAGILRKDHLKKETRYARDGTSPTKQQAEPVYTDEDRAEIEDRLRSLGYLD